MKTLIINGSPKKNGDTAALVNEFARHLEGDVRIVSAFDNIAPCCDCRFCWNHSGCAIQDGMQEIYRYLAECDNVALASPIWFSSLSGPMLSIASRFQTLFCARFRRGETIEPKKNGVLILAGAERGTEVIPAQIASTIAKHMGVRRPFVASVYSLDTDRLPACRDETALRQAREAARLLNSLRE